MRSFDCWFMVDSNNVMKSLYKNSLLSVLLAFSVMVLSAPASADDAQVMPPVKISGYSFDYDAVSETESGIRLETSRFKPLMITNAAADLFGTKPLSDSFSLSTGRSAPHGFAVAAEYLATPDLAFLGAIGVTKGNWDADASLETESSWEANIGLVYRFFNSLSYEVHFGYMDTGDLLKRVDTYSEVESIIMISNQLTLSF